MCARAGRERRPSLRRVYSANPARLQGLASPGGPPRTPSRSALWRAVQAPNRWRLRQDTPASPASRAAPAPRGHPCHLLSRRTPLEREGDAETGTALGWGARQDRSRAFPPSSPGQVWMPRVPVETRVPEKRLGGPARGRARAPWTPPPRPWAARAQQPGGGGEGSPGGARATSEPALPGARGRARASRRRPPLSTRPSSSPGSSGRECRRRAPVPSRAPK